MRPTKKKIAHYISDRLDKGDSINKLSKEVAAYLLSEHRTHDLNSIMRDVIAIRADKGDIEAEVAVAHGLEASSRRDIEKAVKAIRPDAKRVIIDERIDPSLIGGFRLSVIDKSLDLSVRAKLNKLKQMTLKGGV